MRYTPPGDAVAMVSELGQFGGAPNDGDERPTRTISEAAHNPVRIGSSPACPLRARLNFLNYKRCLRGIRDAVAYRSGCTNTTTCGRKRIGLVSMAYRDRLGLTNENRSAGRLGPKIRLPTGLRGRLLLAFAGISSFAVLSAVTAFLAFFVARQALEEMATTRAPLALGATDLLGHSERLVASGPALLSAVNANEVTAVMATMNAELADLHNLLDQMRLAD